MWKKEGQQHKLYYTLQQCVRLLKATKHSCGRSNRAEDGERVK